jgi:putative acetyltransferase
LVDLEIGSDDPRAADVQALLIRHLEFAHKNTPIEHSHALDGRELLEPGITFVSVRRDGALLAIGALKELDPSHGELKSMHTAEAARNQGVGRALVGHLLVLARARGYDRLSLETGTTESFAPARALYARAGFTPCGPFGDYSASPDNAFFTLRLAPR